MPGPQVDLGAVKTLRGVITQGARGGDTAGGAPTDNNNRAFVRKYKVAHSINGSDWNFIMDSKTSLPKVDVGFPGYCCPRLKTALAEKPFCLHRFLKETPTTIRRSCASSSKQRRSTSGSTQSAGLLRELA